MHETRTDIRTPIFSGSHLKGNRHAHHDPSKPGQPRPIKRKPLLGYSTFEGLIATNVVPLRPGDGAG